VSLVFDLLQTFSIGFWIFSLFSLFFHLLSFIIFRHQRASETADTNESTPMGGVTPAQKALSSDTGEKETAFEPDREDEATKRHNSEAVAKHCENGGERVDGRDKVFRRLQ